MAESYRVTSELFLLPAEGGNQIVYAPRRRFACLATPQVANLLSELDQLDPDRFGEDERQVVDFLCDTLLDAER